MKEETQEPMPEQVSVEQVGRRLREAREARGLSREEVAAQLRLQLRLIEALEEGDEAQLPPATFVSGYLRSYARLMEMPEDAVAIEHGDESETPLVSTIASKEEPSSRDWPARLVTYIIIGVIAFSLVMGWMALREDSNTASVQPEVSEPADNASLELPQAEQPQAVAAEPQTESSIEQPVTPARTDAVFPGEPPVVESKTAVNEVEAVTSEEKGPPPLTAEMPHSTLELRYQADSWTEVTDSADRRLAYGLKQAGEVLLLKGEAPFRVFLGYAPGVNVYYNGELFDHSPFQRRDVARFRIGRAEHNHPGSR